MPSETFTSDGTWTVPDGVYKARFNVYGPMGGDGDGDAYGEGSAVIAIILNKMSDNRFSVQSTEPTASSGDIWIDTS